MIEKNYKILEEKISQICLKSGRNRAELTLIAVSKTMPPDLIKEAKQAGLIHFGENKAQEFRDKTQLVNDTIIWHFIGHLQTNKVKYVINSADYIHSVDSIKLAEEINKRAAKSEKVQKILLEVNTSDEEAKYGLKDEKELLPVLEYCKNSAHLEPVGLMTMAPFIEEEKILRTCFARLRSLKEKMNDKGFGLKELSMGMTNDYHIAIEEGATMLRIGTAIFGDRN